MKNDDVLFYWTIVSINWEPVESTELLKLIINHYITIRGFSFASGFMEKYKKLMKKKSKGLRKKLDSATE